MDWNAKWIWIDRETQPINAHVCFRKTFKTQGHVKDAVLRISADTLFRVWINGVEMGEGPIRSSTDHWYYEQYSIQHLLNPSGENIITATVWHYGHSNYQYIENRAGLIAQLDIMDEEGTKTCSTDKTWMALVNSGYEKHVVKRNVNIGWLEVYDARHWNDHWLQADYDDQEWTAATEICRGGEGEWGELYPKQIEPFAKRTIYPRQLRSISEILPIQKVISINTRTNFFPDRRDASVVTMSGHFATIIEVDRDTKGTLTFAHTPWNGLQGRFKIDDQWYASGDKFHLSKGRHLFLVEIAGVHDDAISHMEWDFPVEIRFHHPWNSPSLKGESAFVTFGPFQVVTPIADGRHPVYGGVEKKNLINKELPAFKEISDVSSIEQLKTFSSQAKTVSGSQVMENQMIYSLMLRNTVLRSITVQRQQERLLYAHDLPTLIPLPTEGGDMEIVIDFGKLYVGRVEFELEASEGTVVDVYGFEAIVDGEIRYTSGLNNAFRYTAKEGRQKYKSISRMGFQYLMITIRKQIEPVSIYNVSVEQSGYPVTDQAIFRCSDPALNDIWEISRHTSEVCTEDTFTDCPTYERVFWVGDCRVSALVNYHIFGSYELVKHCLQLVPRSRDQSPLLLSCLPTDWQSVIPMWTFSWMIACKDYYEYSGDKDFYREIYPEYTKTLNAYCEFLNDKDLFDISSWNLVDWAEMDVPYIGIGTAQHGALAYCCQIASEMANNLGIIEDELKWKKINLRMKKALNTHLWVEEKESFIDGQYRTGKLSATYSHQTHVLLYLFDVLPDERSHLIESRLLNPPEEWVKVESPFMSFYLFEAWQKMGRLDLILERIRSVWGTMVRKGSTTCWETYPQTRSFAHAWSAAPAYVMGKQLLGVKRVENGFSRIAIDIPDTALTWVEGSLQTPFGRIDVAWSKEEDKRTIQIKIPESIELDSSEAVEAGWSIKIERFS